METTITMPELKSSAGSLPIENLLYASDWQMKPAERCVLVNLLESLHPSCAIEIGTRYGGSLQVISEHSEKVYSIDIDPTCRDRLGDRFPNVEFVTGPSTETLPPLLKRLEAEEANLGFILVDGDHSAEGAKRDVQNVLAFRPRHPLVVLIHDSFNPDVRRGILQAGCERSPYVHRLDLDLAYGVLSSHPDRRNEMWGGFAIAIMSPQRRSGELKVQREGELLFQAAARSSVYRMTPMRALRGLGHRIRRALCLA